MLHLVCTVPVCPDLLVSPAVPNCALTSQCWESRRGRAESVARAAAPLHSDRFVCAAMIQQCAHVQCGAELTFASCGTTVHRATLRLASAPPPLPNGRSSSHTAHGASIR